VIALALTLAAFGAFGSHSAFASSPATSTTLSLDKTVAALGESVTMTATVTGDGSIPLGSVTFSACQSSVGCTDTSVWTTVGTATLVPASGFASTAVLATSSLAAGTYSIKATFPGGFTANGFFFTSNSTPQLLTVGGVTIHNTTTMLTADPATIVTGQPETLTAVVAVSDGSGLVPTGVVTFDDNGNLLGQATLTSAGVATFVVSDFIAGSHTVTAAYLGSITDHFQSSSASIDLTASNGGTTAVNTVTTVTVNPTQVFAGDTVTITAHVVQLGTPTPPPGASVVTFTTNGVNLGQAGLDLNGNATIIVGGWIAGSYNIQATYVGNIFANSSFGDYILGVNAVVTPSIVYTGQSSTDYNDPATLSATLTDSSSGQPLAHSQVSFSLGGQSCVATTDASGSASCNLAVTQTPGTYPLAVEFVGDGHATLSASASGSFTVAPEQTAISTSFSGGVTTDTLSAMLLEDGVTPVAARSVTLTLGTETCTAVTDASGVASCTVATPRDVPTAEFAASFAGDAYYVPAATSRTVTLPVGSSLAYTGDTTADFGDPAALSATLVDATGAPLGSRPVTLTMGSQSCSATTDLSGSASCTIVVTQPSGSYPVGVAYAGDSLNFTSSAAGAFTVTPEESVLSVTYTSSLSTTTLTGTLLEDGSTPIAGRTLTLSLGSTSCPATTDASGIALCTVPTPTGSPTATLAGTFASDGYYLPAATSRTVTLNIPTTLAYIGSTTADHHDAATLSAALLDSGNAPVGGAAVTLTMGSQSCGATTGSTGVASCAITVSQPAATYPITASFAGRGLYLPSNATGTFTVTLEQTTVISGVSGSLLVGGLVPLTSTLLEDGVAPIAGRTLTLSLGTESCSATTSSSGVALCTVPTPTGSSTPTFTFAASFAGDPNYLPASAANPVTVHVQTTLAYAGSTTADYGDAATLSATLLDSSSAPVAGATVSLTMGSQSCGATTGSTGVASCAITVSQPAGSYPISASFAGRGLYLPSNATGTFTVTREQTTVGTGVSGPVLTGSSVTLTSRLLEDGVTPIAGRTLTLSLGSSTCTGVTGSNGVASCTVSSPGPLGPTTSSSSFAGDDSYLPASSSAAALLYASAPGGGSFIVGDKAAAGTVTFWGSQWWKQNTLSGGGAPSSFKGFALLVPTLACGATWSTDPGNSSPPPAGPLPAYMAVIVTSSSAKSGSTVSGTIAHIVVVKTNAGYDANPGHAGTGTVVATVC